MKSIPSKGKRFHLCFCRVDLLVTPNNINRQKLEPRIVIKSWYTQAKKVDFIYIFAKYDPFLGAHRKKYSA